MAKRVSVTHIPLQLAAFNRQKEVIKWWRTSALQRDTSWLWDAPGDSLLHYASRAGDTATVESLLQEEVNFSAENKHGQSALWVAALAGHVETVKALLLFKICQGKLPDGDDAILATRSVDVLHSVLAIAPLAAIGRIGAKALKQVSREGNTQMVECLLEAGANPNAGDDMEWLFPDVNPPTWGVPGDRALHWAARAGKLKCVELLIRGGASITTLNRRSESALEVAAVNGESDVVKLLLKCGAEFEEGQMKRALRITKCNKVAKILAEAIVKFDGGKDMVWTMASEGEHLPLEALVSAGSSLNAFCLNGWSPLHVAIRKLNVMCINLLLSGGADVNAKDRTGRTPLHDAAEMGDSDCVKLLLSYGARRGSRDRNWKIPQDYAQHTDIYKLLSYKRKK